jgi:superfamily II DNA or RNA helicase
MSVIQLFPHQQQALANVVQAVEGGQSGYLLNLDTGTGKTVVALKLVADRLAEDPSHTTLVVVPKSLVGTWVGEWVKMGYSAADWCVFHGHAKDVVGKPGALTITTKETLLSVLKTHSAAAIFQHEYDLLIVDEAHLLGGIEGRVNRVSPPQYSLVMETIRRTFTLLLTGTTVEPRF